MGKPYKKEIEALTSTYEWANTIQIENLRSFVSLCRNTPLVTVGSGGSSTAAQMATLLHQATGTIAKAVTPLQLVSSLKYVHDYSLLILSAGGKNNDILSAFQFAAVSEIRQLMAICMRPESKLSVLGRSFPYASFLEFNPPSGKDGFVATNSLLAFVILLVRAYQDEAGLDHNFPNRLFVSTDMYAQIEPFATALANKDTWIVLHGGWGFPAAIDIESKCTEAALMHVQIADYRNFAHGRHHWLAKRFGETGIISLITPDERKIAERTLSLIPSEIPIIRLSVNRTGPLGGTELLILALHLIDVIGQVKGIDPGRPGVPAFGRRIYNLRLPYQTSATTSPSKNNIETAAILRKVDHSSVAQMDSHYLNDWRRYYTSYVERLGQTSFGAVVFDYDGTLCAPEERYVGPSLEIGQQLTELLSKGIIIGIATGRGQSVRANLQHLIRREYWQNLFVGYYNGSDIACLDEMDHPDRGYAYDTSLRKLKEVLDRHPFFQRLAKYEARPKQIKVEPIRLDDWKKTATILIDIVQKQGFSGVRVLESGHSLDVIAPGVSKLALVAFCENVARRLGNPGCALCIGDKGRWPGNDHDLLSTPYSLSVDEVSPDTESCWHLGPPGSRGVHTTLVYLGRMSASFGNLRYVQSERSSRQ